jgi:hypothetical protein
MNIVKSAFGRYEVRGNLSEADCVIGHSFGTLTSEGSVNRCLADFILDRAEGRPIIADRMLANAFPVEARQVDCVVVGDITNAIGQGIGSWGTLVEAKQYMAREGLNKSLMVAQAHHIGRVIMQAEKLGIDSVVPANLPDHFDTGSGQVWTRSELMWVPREVLGSLALRAQKKL